ncbi:exonuclease SbcCD subunit D C-terminal domain-containing protein [bacterium]|nr:exonuclease SbcCD subunit D C-terminal domain-containing protein [candidate division CSSED10-310 bacterium]
MLTFIHTSDWHIGRKLGHIERYQDHEVFLDWLLKQMEASSPDALLVSGDIFDSSNPPIPAMRMFIEFVVKAATLCPNIILTAGNHDSPGRLDTLRPVFDILGVHVVGSVSDPPSRMLLPLTKKSGETIGHVLAMPYIRPMDLPPPNPGEDVRNTTLHMISAFQQRYIEPFTGPGKETLNDLPLIIMGHLFISGGDTTDESERPIQLEAGSIVGLPASIFPPHADYIALGHLHRPQMIKGTVPIAYCGSPFPLTFSEANYTHRILKVTLDDSSSRPAIESVPVPRNTELYNITGDMNTVCNLLNRMTKSHPPASSSKAYARVTVSLEKPVSNLKEQIIELTEGSNLIILSVRRSENAADSLAQMSDSYVRLDELTPEQVFITKYRETYNSEPALQLVQAFRELLGEVLIEMDSPNQRDET